MIILNGINGLGPKRMSNLLGAFGSGEAVLRAPMARLAMVQGMSQPLAAVIKRAHENGDPIREFDTARKLGLSVLVKGKPGYPEILTPLDDSPPLLFVKGNTDILHTHDAVAMVGSRECTAAGRMIASSLARDLGYSGLVVVSGLARGMDTVCHQGALAGGGYTIAVVGTGLDMVYPLENTGLQDRITSQGCVVSQFNPGMKPLPGNFPARNRIISGLSHGVILVEAALKSGALITADCALNHGREVMAVPGSPLNTMAAGPNRLIKQGAFLVESAEDVISAIASRLVFSASQRGTLGRVSGVGEGDDPILGALSNGPMSPEGIAVQAGLGVAEVTSRLTILRIQGRVTGYPGDLFGLSD